MNSLVYLSNRPRLCFSSQGLSVIVLVLQTVKMSSSSSNVPTKGRGGVPTKGRGGRGGVLPPSIFPKVVYPVEPGSPAGIEPPAANTIPKSFDKQNSKASDKADRHADTKARIVQFLAPPPSHHDPLRVTPVDQLAALSDPELVDKAL